MNDQVRMDYIVVLPSLILILSSCEEFLTRVDCHDLSKKTLKKIDVRTAFKQNPSREPEMENYSILLSSMVRGCRMPLKRIRARVCVSV